MAITGPVNGTLTRPAACRERQDTTSTKLLQLRKVLPKVVILFDPEYSNVSKCLGVNQEPALFPTVRLET